MKRKTTKKENRTANLESLRKESQKVMKEFIKSRQDALSSIFNSIDLSSITAISANAQNAINAVAASMEQAKKTIEMINNEKKGMSLTVPLLSHETRTEIILHKIYDTLDKNLGGDKINKEIKNKIAYCRFCGTIIMRVEELSYFTKATIKCAKCEKVLRIPQDLNFKEPETI